MVPRKAQQQRAALARAAPFLVPVALLIAGAIFLLGSGSTTASKQGSQAAGGSAALRSKLLAPAGGAGSDSAAGGGELAAAATAAAATAAPDRGGQPAAETGEPAGAAAAGGFGSAAAAGSDDWLRQIAPSGLPGCPLPWLAEYEAFHAAARGQPNAKYLLHISAGGSGGLGDRMRSMMFALRAAAAARRVVLFRWDVPHALGHFFEPAGGVDWRPEGLALPAGGPLLKYLNKPVAEIVNGSLLTSEKPLITLQANEYIDGACKGCPNVTLWGADAACLWLRLFRPKPDIQQQASAQIKALYGAPAPKYVAIHMRMGKLTGEGKLHAVRGGGQDFENFMAAVSCANRMAAHIGAAGAPILMLVDNHQLRDFIKAKNLANIVTADARPVHLDYARTSSAEAHKSTIVDLLMLARATCLVTSPSGFSHHAWLAGGGKACQRAFLDCATVEGGPGGGPDDGQLVRPHGAVA